jgi:signal transduction histidine kinase
MLFGSCQPPGAGDSRPVVEVTNIPSAEPGNRDKLTTIAGRAIGAQPNQQIVLYARSNSTWYVQPYANQPFTTIETDGRWRNSTHPGIEYAALLVGPEFHPAAATDALPTDRALAWVVTKGQPPVWRRWWFASACLGMTLVAFVAHWIRLNQIRNKLHVNLRFEERLAERMRVAQILHDTLLQGVVSASMQLHVVVDQLPADSPARGAMDRVLQSMGQVLEEGRHTLRALRSPMDGAHDLERSLYRIPEELGLHREVGYRVTITGPTLPLQPNVCAQVYAIGREALAAAFQHGEATKAELELRYAPKEFRFIVRHDVSETDVSAAHADRMRERAVGIGARLDVRNRIGGGTQVRLRVPGHVAFESPFAERASIWSVQFHTRRRRPLDLEGDGAGESR